MTTKIDDLLAQILEEYFKNKYKSVNYTDTYSRKSLLECIAHLTDRLLYLHCTEDREAMAWIDKNIDELAEKEVEHKDSLNKPYQ
jgi:hypothetical protein